MSKTYEERLEEVLEQLFKEHGVDPSDGMTDEELGKAEELTKRAQDIVKAELGIV